MPEREREREREQITCQSSQKTSENDGILYRAAKKECSPALSLEKRYLLTLKKSLLNDFYVENDARMLYLTGKVRTWQSIDWRAVTNPRQYIPKIVQYIEEMHKIGNSWYFLRIKNNDGSVSNLDLRNYTDFAYSMIGRIRMDNIESCLDIIRTENIPGDLIETGVCRGGAVIFMQGYLKTYGMDDRIVWAADSYEGLPEASLPEDAGLHATKKVYPALAIDLDRVKDAFARYDLLDQNVFFLKGWFKDTLPKADIGQLALLRLDGDFYESTRDALVNLYAKLVSGGFIIIDDYGCFPQCKKAVDEFREQHNIKEPIIQLDWAGCFWRKK